MVVEEREQVIHQRVLRLPYFNEEVPVLHLGDGKSYVPVIALCEVLGLCADKHIPKWRKLVLWVHARKLLFHTATGRKQRVWCLHIGAIPLWCACFDWSLVSPERQKQLQLATDAWSETAGQAYQEILNRYRQIRNLLFGFLMAYEDMDTRLSQLAACLHPILDDFDLCIQLEELIAQGQAHVQSAVHQARQMLQEQATHPVIDAVRIGRDGQVLEELSLPLFPVFLGKDCAKFFEHIAQVSQWHQQLMAFLREHGIWLNNEQ